MRNVYLKYNDLAKSKGLYIVNACGLESLPTDLGVRLLKNNFNGKVDTIETYLRFKTKSKVIYKLTNVFYSFCFIKGFCINYGTWISLLNGFELFEDLGINRNSGSNSQIHKDENKLKLKYV